MLNKSESGERELNLSEALAAVIAEIVRACPSLGHIDLERVLVCIGSNRGGRRGGVFGKLVPLKFQNGAGVLRYRGSVYALPEISREEKSILYLVYFYMPRFFDLPWEEKLRVMFHELYHISPRFNGDIRRMGKVKAAHGHSKKRFDSLFTHELSRFAADVRETGHFDFLRMDSKSLFSSYTRVSGIRMKNPRPVIIHSS